MALNARNSQPVGSTKASKPSKQLRPQVVAMQKQGVQVLPSRAEAAASKTSARQPVHSAYTSTQRVSAVSVSKPRVMVK